MKLTHAIGYLRPVALRVAILAVGVATVTSASALTLRFKIKNNTGGNVTDVHLLFANTGNSITNRVVLQPGGGVINASGGNEFDADFNLLANGGFLIGKFDVDPGPVVLNSGFWTLNKVPVGNIDVPGGGIPIGGSGGDVVYFEAVPEPASMAALGIAALAVLKRRKRSD